MTEKIISQAINWDDVKECIKQSSKESCIYIGCDSQQTGKTTRFGLAVVIHHDGQHGGKIFGEISYTHRISSLKERLMKEVEYVTNGAIEIVDIVGDRHFEIHLDINPDPEHKSNIVIKEAIGWVKGLGLDCYVKPEAWCATHAGDHIVRN